MELRHLRTFVVVAETLNISEAARRMRVTQPALSRHIRDLEYAIGHPLFIRQPGRLRLTPAGEMLRDRGTKALAALEDAMRTTRAVATAGKPPLQVGYYGTVNIWALILAPALEKLGRKFPHTTANITELMPGQLMVELQEGRLEIAILGPGVFHHTADIIVESACTMDGFAIVAANHRLAKKRMISLDELREEKIVALDPKVSPGRDQAFIDACKSVGFTPRITHVVATYPEAIVEIRKRLGVGIIGALALAAPHPGVVFIKIKPPGIQMEFHVAHAARASSEVRLLADLIRGEARRAMASV